MSLTKFRPPFTNNSITDFFDYKCKNQHKAIYIRDWIGDSYPDFEIRLKYHIPFYFCEGKPILYLHYSEYEEEMDLEVSFINADQLSDSLNIFEPKNHKTKAIHIVSTDDQFLEKLKIYINQSLRVNNISVY
jgi:hypothetical protein